MKIVSIDIETTGINVDDCDIVEFAAIIDDLNNPLMPIESLPKFHCYFQPPVRDGKRLFQGEPYALSMHPASFRRIAEREKGFNHYTPENFGWNFAEFLRIHGEFKPDEKQDRFVINVAGKNPSFDINFLERKTNINKHVRMRHRVIDPSILFLNKDDEAVPGTEILKERCGMGSYVAHNAMDDAMDVIKVIRFATSNNLLFNFKPAEQITIGKS